MTHDVHQLWIQLNYSQGEREGHTSCGQLVAKPLKENSTDVSLITKMAKIFAREPASILPSCRPLRDPVPSTTDRTQKGNYPSRLPAFFINKVMYLTSKQTLFAQLLLDQSMATWVKGIFSNLWSCGRILKLWFGWSKLRGNYPLSPCNIRFSKKDTAASTVVAIRSLASWLHDRGAQKVFSWDGLINGAEDFCPWQSTSVWRSA